MSSRFHLELGYLVVSIWKAKFSICFTVIGVNVRVSLGFPNVFNEYVRKAIATFIDCQVSEFVDFEKFCYLMPSSFLLNISEPWSFLQISK